MSDLTCNGVAVLKGDVLMPRFGAWSSELVLDTASIPSNPIVIESTAGLRLVGAVERGDSTEGRVELRVRGGVGNLRKVLPPVGYRISGGVRVGTILGELARDSGESISPLIDRAITETYLDAWIRERGTVAGAIRALAVELGCSWRLDANGRVLLVRESWPAVDPQGVQLLSLDPHFLGADLAVDVLTPDFVPGMTWQGRHVSGVELYLLSGGASRVRLLFEDAINETLTVDRHAMRLKHPDYYQTEKTAYDATYTGRIVAQSADLATVDVELEPDVPDERKMMPGLVRVPLYGSVPGMVLDLGVGLEPLFCLVEFANRDRMKPFVAQWKSSPSSNSAKRANVVRVRGQELQLGEGNARGVARVDDTIGAGALVATVAPFAPSGVSIILTYTPPGGAPQVSTINLAGPVIGAVVGTPLAIAGKITSASPKVKTD